MKVKELIAKLQELPPDMRVCKEYDSSIDDEFGIELMAVRVYKDSCGDECILEGFMRPSDGREPVRREMVVVIH